MASLNLLVILERTLGRKLSFDALWPDMKVADLARLLFDGVPRAVGDRAETTVFLFPGMFGDDPRLAAFRKSFGGRLHFHLIDHPDITAPRALLRSLPEVGRVAAREIGGRQPEGPLFLAGYSFGGGVAFEAATQLAQEGRQLGFMAVIDTPLVVPSPSLLERPRRMLLRLIGRSDRGRRLALPLIDRFLPAWSPAGRRRFVETFSLQALSRWKPSPLRTFGMLAVSDEFADTIVEPWRRLCPGIRIVRVPARHGTVFSPSSLAVLIPAIEESVRLARTLSRSE